ncbi:MAG: DegV family protein [Lachnospiraceae bacterium]|nr:DegV family protein [Lachnospiraceae bacterium]
MGEYVITCCSTADWPKERLVQRKIHSVPFHVEIGGREYLDDAESLPLDSFYAMEREGAVPRSSQVNQEEYMAFWTPFLREGLDVLHVTLSSGISGSFNTACLAAEELSHEFPDRRVIVVDSLGASSGYGLLMEEIAEKRDCGLNLWQLSDYAEATKLHIQHWFFASELNSLVRGGRISAVNGAVGTMLGICPLMHVDRDGKLVPKAKIRTKRKVIDEMVRRMEEHADHGSGYSGPCAICHSDCADDAARVRDKVEERFPLLKGKIIMCRIGAVIGAHTGPSTVALFFIGDER